MTASSTSLAPSSAEATWRSAWEEHGPGLLGFLRRRLRRREDAEDLLQETFVKAIHARPEGLPGDGVRPYLFTTAHRLLTDRGRRQGEVLFSEVGEEGAPHELPDLEAASPDERIEGDRLRRRLRETLDRLPQAHRAAYEMAVLSRLPYGEICRRLGWSAELVRVNVHRARRRVLAELASELQGVES